MVNEKRKFPVFTNLIIIRSYVKPRIKRIFSFQNVDVQIGCTVWGNKFNNRRNQTVITFLLSLSLKGKFLYTVNEFLRFTVSFTVLSLSKWLTRRKWLRINIAPHPIYQAKVSNHVSIKLVSCGLHKDGSDLGKAPSGGVLTPPLNLNLMGTNYVN